MKAYKFSAFIVCLLFVLSACAPATPPPAGEAAPPTTAAATEQAVAAEATPTPQPLGLLPDAPQYGKHGPFWVGYKPLVIGEGTDRKLDVSLWYPALNPDGAKEEITYTITPKNPARPSDRPAFVRGHALENAAIDRSGAPYPLVVFSPGFSGNAASYGTSLEHYASHGFVVLAPNTSRNGIRSLATFGKHPLTVRATSPRRWTMPSSSPRLVEIWLA